jgi:hypothetical protein
MRTPVVLAFALVLGATAVRADPAPALFSDADNGDDPAPTLKKVRAELALAKKGKPRTIMLAASTTDNWGCECLPFVYAPFAISAPDGPMPFFFPITATGVNPGKVTAGSSMGIYELTGHFTKERITEQTWLTRSKLGRSGDRKQKAPVFAVDSWCFRKSADAPDYAADIFTEMQQANVPFCE